MGEDGLVLGVSEAGEARELPEYKWVEVRRVSRLTGFGGDANTEGQLWFWVAPGSRIWLNVGRSLVRTNPAASEELWKAVPRVIVGRHPNDNRPAADGRSDFGGLRVPTAAAWSYSLRGGFADPWRPIRRTA